MSALVCLVGAGDGAARETQRFSATDPLYLDPTYYDAYYGYWTDEEAPAASALA